MRSARARCSRPRSLCPLCSLSLKPFLGLLRYLLFARWVHSHYSVSQAASDTIIGGYSLGALEATYAASKRPDLFGAILAQSPSLHWAPGDASTHDATPWMAHMLVEAAQRPKRIYVSFGRDEPTITDKVQAFERVLRAAGQEIRCEEIEGQHDPINWRLTFPRGLLWLTGHTQTP